MTITATRPAQTKSTKPTRPDQPTNQPVTSGLTVPISVEQYADFPTVQVWEARYQNYRGAMLTGLAITAQENLIGVLFRGEARELRYCIDSGMSGRWFGLDVFSAACDVILAIPGAGDRDLDVLEVRDALVNEDCLGDRPYQIPTSRWCELGSWSSWMPVDHHVERLENVYNGEAARIREALEQDAAKARQEGAGSGTR